MYVDAAPTGAIAFLVRTLRGLEQVAASEVRERLGIEDPEIGHRELHFSLPRLTPELVGLGTADDVFLVVYDGPPVGHRRSELERLRRLGGRVDLDGARALVSALRPIPTGRFGVTASFLGRRNYSRFEIEDAVAAGITAASGWAYCPRARRPGGGLALRVHLTAERTTVAARISAAPLRRRSYTRISRPGALHPPLANALVRLARPPERGLLLDPFCGTGTIAIEAKLAFPRLTIIGCDIDSDAIAAARRHATAAGVAAELRCCDAASVPVADGSVDVVATNPPWSRRVSAGGQLRASFDAFWHELARVVRAGGRAALLTQPAAARETEALELEERFPVHVFGAWVEVAVLRAQGLPTTGR